MDCREFCDNHLAFVDDTLAGVELVRMQLHLTECDVCAQHDATIRRSLMLFRNLPRIEPSADFSKRLEIKLHEVKMADAAANHRSSLRFRAGVAVASAVMLAYIGVSLRHVDTPQDLVLPPVVATATTSEVPTSGPAPEMIAAVPAGIPIWTAALFAEQTPAHFASIQLVSAAR
ncbi:MAG TPA: hypothetical protein VF042_14445 [Gemmatimonadaceae bacterium]